MPYARFDDRYDDHKKIKRAWRLEPAAVGLHAMALTYSARHELAGRVDVDWIEERLNMTPHRRRRKARIVAVLLDVGLLERIDDEWFRLPDATPERRVPLPQRVRLEVIERDGLLCGICGASVRPDDVHIDHILPVVLGGGDEHENLRVTHSRCNLAKGGRL